MKHKIILALLVCSLFGAPKTFACDCARISTEQAVEQSKAVFSGEVVGFEYRKGIPNQFVDEQARITGTKIEYETLVVKVRVNRWWKGEPPAEIYLLTSTTRNADGTSTISSCDHTFDFGATYLIFATKYNVKEKNEYRTSDCLRTRKLTQADNDLKILGEPKAYAQDISAIAGKVKAIVKEQASCWKLYNQQERKNTEIEEINLNWTCGRDGVIAYIYQAPSVETAIKWFYELRTSPVASPVTSSNWRNADSYKFGDESSIRSNFLYSSSSYVFFRKGNIVVRIDSGSSKKTTSARTLKNAVLFARLINEQIRI